ncbi:hypothetical protein RND81_10G100600 [Saponaria officinalis]|uniref:NB-ARC domain-containing protein n=1 Tax=Saponaria officinalis TaxID=3572 RepID=A0AAW1I2W6_SAPOF
MDGNKRVRESINSVLNKQAQIGRFWITHERLWRDIFVLVAKLETISYKLLYRDGDESDEIMYEDSRAKLMDCMERLTTPCPYTKQDMFGREKEIDYIKSELLNEDSSDSDLKSPVITIAGEAGMGKTMLAQCLFDDKEVCEASEYQDWINCNDMEVILDDDKDDGVSWGKVENLLHKLLKLQGNNCKSALIVFDGWTTPELGSIHSAYFTFRDNHKRPNCVKKNLKIIVTIRSTTITTMSHYDTRHSPHYKEVPQTFQILEGLVEEESWAMFENIAFSSDLSKEDRTKILDSKIGRKILSMCNNNPCVIKTIASILSTKTTLDEWTHFAEVVWPSIPVPPLETIASIFNLVTFKRLPFLMKRCLLFCSLFPKDYEFNRVDLNLWLAREFKFKNIITKNIITTEDVELCGVEFLRRLHKMGYFVEYGKIDDNNTLMSYKMPIFCYEFVKYMAKLEYNEYESVGTRMHPVNPDTIRHVSFIVDDASWHAPPWLPTTKKLRSILFFGDNCQRVTSIEDNIASLKYLQILSGNIEISERLLSKIDTLELLRSLRLKTTNSKFLGEFVTRSKNLRLLDLQHSDVLVMSKEFHKLEFLRHLYVGCNLNNKVTPSFGELVSLTEFNVFTMGRPNNNDLNKLIDYNFIVENRSINYETRCGILKDSKISDVALCWQLPSRGNDDIVVKTLQAPNGLETMTIRFWKGLTVPRFHGLVSLQIIDCHECRCLPSFGTLHRLKFFKLWNLDALEYIEKDDYPENESYFSSLESLILGNLPNVKAWKEHDTGRSKIIPRLTELQISNTKLEFLPVKETIVSLAVKDISDNLLKYLINTFIVPTPTVIATTQTMGKLKTLNISAIHGLETIWIDHHVIESLIIRQCHQLTSLSVETCPLKLLLVHECGKLRNISKFFKWLTKLDKLEIDCCEELDLQEIGPWKSLNNLRHLTLVNFANLESLPSDVSCLTAIETMSICWVYNLKELPEWIGSLKHLRRVVVRNCPSLSMIPESLGYLIDASSDLRVEFRGCDALKRLPKSFSRNQSSRLVIKECPKLERSMTQVGSV